MSEPASADRGLWFLSGRVWIRVSCGDSADGISVLEHEAPHGESPPLHIHRNQDEVFHVLEGELRVVVSGNEFRARAGETFIGQKGQPHTYRIESPHGARWLIVTVGTDFERFVRALGRAAERDGIPDPASPLSPEAVEALTAAARQHGIDIVGPPLD
jgi:quercetin dioxygenase-like cupin family protein